MVSKLQEALSALRPKTFSDVPVNDLGPFLSDIFSKAELIANSVPPPPGGSPYESAQRSRTDATPATSAADLTVSTVRRPQAEGELAKLQSAWGKPVKLSSKENQSGISVYKMAAHDRHGAWFARSSVHEGLGFAKWKRAMMREFPESLEVQGGPGEGNIRGIGGDKRLEEVEVDGIGKMEVYQLSAQFPGPTAPREFITLLLTSDNCFGDASKVNNTIPRHYVVVSIPVEHPDAPPRQGLVRGFYESVEIIREIPLTDGKSDPETNPVEWIMITRSDPGGGIPRFMVERNTPSSIVGDAVKFLNWACARDDEPAQESTQATEEGASPAPVRPSFETERSFSISQSNGILAGVGTSIADNPRPLSYRQPSHQGQQPTLLQTLAEGAADYVPDFIAERLPLQRSDTSSSSSTETTIDSFASAEQFNDTAQNAPAAVPTDRNGLATSPTGVSADHTLQSPPDASSHTNVTSRELQKIEQKTKALKDKMFSSHHGKDTTTKDSDSTSSLHESPDVKLSRDLEKATQKHNASLAKQQDKFARELAKLERKRERETKKILARQQKEEQKAQHTKIQNERDEWKDKAQKAEREVLALKSQIGELQKENTALVARIGRTEGGLDVLKSVKDEVGGKRERGSSVASAGSGRSGRARGSKDLTGSSG